MFKSALWRSDKNKVKVEFKLQFRVTKVPQVGEDALVISVVPADSGKTTVKSDKVAVRDGSCFWENPVYEAVKFNRDPKSGKIHEKIYYFVVGTGSSKAGVIGEASIDLSNYVEAAKVLLVSLPLKNSNTGAVLHVSIQRMQDSNDQREFEGNENAKLNYKERSLKAQFGNGDTDATIKSNSADMELKNVSHIAELNGIRRASSGSDVTMSSSESSSGVEIPWQPQMKNDSVHQEPAGILSSQRPQGPKPNMQAAACGEHHRSQWEWLRNSSLEASTDDCLSIPRETLLRQHLEEASDIVAIEKLKSDIAALSRQAEMSELELQSLRKQIVKESKRGQDLFRELVCLKEERDALKGECEKLKAFKRNVDETKTKTKSQFEGEDSQAIVEELRQELNHAKELNSNLQIQLQKTQESNSELILAVQDLDEMIEQKNSEILNFSSRSLAKGMAALSQELYPASLPCNDDEDEEQKVLEELVKEHSETKEAYLLEQQIIDMRSEIEIFKRDKDELEMQMEQLALDYEILKQENHDMAYKLEQSQLQEQLKLQYECSSSYAAVHELENQIEKLENELKRQSKESDDAFIRVSELEAHVKSLEEELEKQSQGVEADIEALTRSKVEHEQRAIRAEETLRKTRYQNAKTAERLQEELRRLSVQMASSFAFDEKLASKALAEANELRLQKSHLEEMIQKASEEKQSIKGQYEARLHQLDSEVMLMTNQIERMQSEIEYKELQLEHQKKHAVETQKVLSDEILKFKDEIKTYTAKNRILSEELESKETLMHQLEQMRISIKEMELLLEQGNNEKNDLENRIMLVNSEAEERQKELNKMICLVEEKESIAGSLRSELDSLHLQFMELKHSIVDGEQEKEKLSKQVLLLESDLKKREDELSSMQKMIKDGSDQGNTIETSETDKPVPNGSKEALNLIERIKLLECQIQTKESALETSSNEFLEKEKDLHNKIEELQGRMEVLNQCSIHCYDNEVENLAALAEDQVPNAFVSKVARNDDCNSSSVSKLSDVEGCAALSLTSNSSNAMHSNGYIDELRSEMALLKERNVSMEEELKEMQERYSEISLKFAEVEGERQQLIMKVRNMKNARKRS